MGNEDDASVAALEELYRSRYRRFFRVAIAVTGSREAAADTVQEGFARALRHATSFAARDRSRPGCGKRC